MRRTMLASAVVSAVWLTLSGCASQPDARYVYQDGEFGVIAVPRNTIYGKKNFQEQAHELMARHFPEGYEVVRSEEVVEGQRILDKGKKTEIETEPTLRALDQMVKLGKLDQVTSLSQKDQIPILESRIIYKRKMVGQPGWANGFSTVATATPRYYIDPNEVLRCRSQQLIADAEKGTNGPKKDGTSIQKAVHDSSPK